MERKSIGSFMAVLRKANGLTQKDLAEKLNVSDKTISRWERDDGAPDLSVIPVIAEIFGVTCDELLKGERQPAARQAEQHGEDKPCPKTDKQRQRILAVSLSRYKNRSLIGVGISVTGFLAAMVCNFGFQRAYIGFFVGSLFFLGAIICQAIFINGAFLSVLDDEIVGAEVERFKRCVISLGEKAISITAVLLAISLPLIVFPTDTYMGLTAESWLLLALIFGLTCIVLCSVICYFLNNRLQKRKVYTLGEKESVIYEHNFKLKRSCALILLAALAITLICNVVATGAGDFGNVATGTSFDDFTSFKAYMEQDIQYEQNDGAPGKAVEQAMPGSEHYFDENGKEITKDEAMTRTITDQDGNVLCTYIERNETVWRVRYGHFNGEILPITTFTKQDMDEAQRTIAGRNAVFGVIYLLEISSIFFVYLRKRAR